MAEAHTKLYTKEQMEVLMAIASAERPIAAAIACKEEWVSELRIAGAAKRAGIVSLMTSLRSGHPDQHIDQANSIITAIDEWLAERRG